MGKKKAISLFLVIVLSALFITGCSKETIYVPVASNTIEITENGEIVGYIVEPFDKEYYDIQELAAMAETEINEYNTEKKTLVKEAGGVPVVVDKVIMAEDGSKNAVVALKFYNTAVYEDYMGRQLFHGTVEEAIIAGYDIDKKLSKVKGGDLLTGDLLQKNKDKKILILEAAVSVRLPQTIQFLSSNTKMDDYGYVDCTANEELKYIIYK
ncbi:MAG: hypothetical protein IKK33_05490 [Lachnospiraceae bacterium]|nr:hypothetical protein [Lachnospiraceae bacterium]